MTVTKKQVEKANLKFFKAKAKSYNKEEPSYRPENIARVKNILRGLSKNKNDNLLDIGCGTGFILDLAHPFFKKLYGIDLSAEMLKHVNLKNKKIKVFEGSTEKIPFEKNYFDVCTAYGFLHHLYDIKSTLKEAYRCLKKNGILYTDQDPNYYFWENASQFKSKTVKNNIPKTEIQNVSDVTFGYKKKKLSSLSEAGKKTIITAEFQKSFKLGFQEEKILKMLKNIGFRKIKYSYEWYLGEAYVKHKISSKSDKIISDHLQRCLPLSRNLFKYVKIFAVK